MEETIVKLIGKDLTKGLERILKEFIRLNYDIDEIYRNIKGLNDISIMALYLLATKYKGNTAYYIKEAYDRLLDRRVEGFKKSVKEKNPAGFLCKLDKNSVINLAYYMNLYNISDITYEQLDNKNKKYYKILKDYIDNMI